MTFEILGINQVTPTRVGETRSLPHIQRPSYTVTWLFTWEPEGWRAGKVDDWHECGHFHHYSDWTINPLMRLSKFLQRKEISLADGMERVSWCAAPNVWGYKKKFLNEIVKALEKRFPFNDVVEARNITSFTKWPIHAEKKICCRWQNLPNFSFILSVCFLLTVYFQFADFMFY